MLTSQVREQLVLPVVKPVFWSAPTWQKMKEKVSWMATENGVAAAQHNLYLHALRLAEDIAQPVKYQKA